MTTNKEKQPTEDKRKNKRTKKPTALTSVKNGKRKISIGDQLITKTQSEIQEMERKKWDYCVACNQGGNLIEHHTCIHVSHAEYGNNMPINYADMRVVWRCTACEKEDGKHNARMQNTKSRANEKKSNNNEQGKIYNDKK